MQPSQSDNHALIVNHVIPGHALTTSRPPYFLNSDALNFAALDYLTDFIAKVSRVRDLSYNLAGFSQSERYIHCLNRKHEPY